ncbi:TPM domain-containing protein [Thermodesulfobacteriota bacterium]
MKDLTKNFLSESDREKIKAAVSDAEKLTSGEIVPMVVSSSYHYPVSDIAGAVTIALPLSVILTILLGGWLWLGTNNMWLFIPVFAVTSFIFHQIVKHTLWLKRLFVSKREMNEEVEEAAITGFFNQGLYRTRDETGVLVFISIFEHKVTVLADRGINEKVREGQWDNMVEIIVGGIKQGKQADAICEAVKEIGQLLQSSFPVREDDKNELNDLIVNP